MKLDSQYFRSIEVRKDKMVKTVLGKLVRVSLRTIPEKNPYFPLKASTGSLHFAAS